MDLLNMQTQMQRDPQDLGISSLALGMGITFDDLSASDRRMQ